MSASAISLVRDIVSVAIAPIDLERHAVAITEDDGDAVLAALREHRVEGLAVRAVTDGLLDAPSSVAAALVQRHDETMARTLRIEIATIRVSELLADHGIAHRVMKGVALAHQVHDRPELRSFRDVDVLVPSSSIDDAIAMLEFEGARRLQPSLRAGFDARFGKSVTLSLDGVEVDVHRLLAPGPFGVWMYPADLFLLGRTIELAGTTIPTFDRTEHLVHACYHAALGSAEPVLASLYDIAVLANGEVDGERFDQMVHRWRGAAVIRRAVRLVEDALSTTLPERLAKYRHRAIDERELTAIEPYLTTDPRGRFAALAPATLRALPMSERPAFALAVGLPDGTSPGDRLRSLIDRVR